MAVMATISVMESSNFTPTAEVMTLDDGRRFISLKVDEHGTVLLPGFGAEAAAYARTLATALNRAADRCEQPADVAEVA